MIQLKILYEDNHLLVVNKPAGLATMGAGGAATVHQIACRYLAEKYAKPGKVFLGIVHRLDAMSSGVLVLARTSKSAARLSDQFRRSSDGPGKIYLAAVEGDIVPSHGRWRDRIAKNEALHRMEISASSEAVDAELTYQVLRPKSASNGGTLVAVKLLTGRKHQIRVQFAERGYALIGDVKYGANRQSFTGIALHAWSLTINHPTKATPLTFRAPPPPSWGKWQPTAHELAEIGL